LVARDGANLVLHKNRIRTAFTPGDERHPACASMFSGTGLLPPAYPGYGTVNTRFTGSTSVIEADAYVGWGSAVGFNVRQTGCGALNMLAVGVAALGQNVTFYTSQSYPLQAYAFGTSLSVPIPGCPGCTAGVDGILVTTNSLSIDVPTTASLFGAAFSVQAIALGGGSCFGALSLSETYDFVIQ
jgi:hypothetical protein